MLTVRFKTAGLNKATRPMARNSTVINACFPLNIAPIEVPRYRAVNEEVVKLDLDFGDAFSGVLVDKQDHLRALWASYSEQVCRRFLFDILRF